MSTLQAPEPAAVPSPQSGLDEVVVEPSQGGFGRVLRSPWTLAVGLYLAITVVYTALSLHTALPLLFPDEFRYSHLARSLADGHGFDWRGQHVDQTAALFIYFITPAYLLFESTVAAWHATKVMGTVALCAQFFPVWLLAREILGRPKLALVPAVLAVAGTWMLSSAEVVTENLAFPLVTAALCCAVMALRRPGSRWGWLAIGFVLLGTWARVQVAVIVPALMFTLMVDIVRDPAQRSARLRAHRPYLIVAVAGVALLTLAALAAPGVAGDYSKFFDDRPPLGDCLTKTGWQLLELCAVAGFLPVVLAAAGIFSRPAWRDPDSGPLLAVFWPAALATVVQSGFFLATQPPSISPIGRYVTYAVPIALVLMMVFLMRPALLTRFSLIVAGLLTLGLLTRPATKMMGEERSSWAISYRFHEAFGIGPGLAGLTVALVLLALVVFLRRRSVPSMRAAIIVSAALGAVFVVQSQASWWQMFNVATSFDSVMPEDLQWVDRHASGPVALLAVTQNAPQFDDIDFFNRKVTQAYGPASGLQGRAVQGNVCPFQFDASGLLQVSEECGPMPHGFLINDPSARITFHDEISSATTPNVGRVVEVARTGTPRGRSLVILPCPRMTPGYVGTEPKIAPASKDIRCRPALNAMLWLDTPGTLRVRYSGGAREQTVTTGTRRWSIPAGEGATVTVKIPQGSSRFTAQQDWISNKRTPQVKSITLEADGRETPLI